MNMSKEGCGRSAHIWSSYQRVGSLSRIGYTLKTKEPYQRKCNAPVFQEHFTLSGSENG